MQKPSLIPVHERKTLAGLLLALVVLLAFDGAFVLASERGASWRSAKFVGRSR
jgi:hypothetical protein